MAGAAASLPYGSTSSAPLLASSSNKGVVLPTLYRTSVSGYARTVISVVQRF